MRFLNIQMGDLDEFPDDSHESDEYIEIPHKNDLGLGKDFVFEFVSQHLPEEFDRVQNIFTRRGAYSRFKDLLERHQLLQNWYEFENIKEEQALRDWCKDNGMELSD